MGIYKNSSVYIARRTWTSDMEIGSHNEIIRRSGTAKKKGRSRHIDIDVRPGHRRDSSTVKASAAPEVEPRILQKLPGRWSVPRVQFHHFSDKVPVRPCEFIVFGLGKREPLLVLLYIDNCTRADCKAFRVSHLLETVIERPEAPDLLHEHPKPVMFIVKGNICWTTDMPVSAEYETDQLHRSVQDSWRMVFNYIP